MKTIDYGMPTLIETDGIEKCARLCKELGLDFIEINMNMPEYQIDTIDVEQLNRIRREENIYFTIHLDENLNICDFNSEVSKAYLKTVMDAINIAKEADIPVLNMHMINGVYFKLPDRKVFLFSQYKDIYLSKLKAFRDMCEKAIGDSSIKICIENCSGFMDFAKEGIELLLESRVFGITLDIGHNYSANGIDQPFIYKHIERLHHMHVHDGIDGKNHLPIGTGEINIEEKLRLAGQRNCRMVLETKNIEGLKQSVEKLNLLG